MKKDLLVESSPVVPCSLKSFAKGLLRRSVVFRGVTFYDPIIILSEPLESKGKYL